MIKKILRLIYLLLQPNIEEKVPHCPAMFTKPIGSLLKPIHCKACGAKLRVVHESFKFAEDGNRITTDILTKCPNYYSDIQYSYSHTMRSVPVSIKAWMR